MRYDYLPQGFVSCFWTRSPACVSHHTNEHSRPSWACQDSGGRTIRATPSSLTGAVVTAPVGSACAVWTTRAVFATCRILALQTPPPLCTGALIRLIAIPCKTSTAIIMCSPACQPHVHTYIHTYIQILSKDSSCYYSTQPTTDRSIWLWWRLGPCSTFNASSPSTDGLCSRAAVILPVMRQTIPASTIHPPPPQTSLRPDITSGRFY
jgi:hypothetical protein